MITLCLWTIHFFKRKFKEMGCSSHEFLLKIVTVSLKSCGVIKKKKSCGVAGGQKVIFIKLKSFWPWVTSLSIFLWRRKELIYIISIFFFPWRRDSRLWISELDAKAAQNNENHIIDHFINISKGFIVVKIPLYTSSVDKYAVWCESKKLNLSANAFCYLFNSVLIS